MSGWKPRQRGRGGRPSDGSEDGVTWGFTGVMESSYRRRQLQELVQEMIRDSEVKKRIRSTEQDLDRTMEK